MGSTIRRLFPRAALSQMSGRVSSVTVACASHSRSWSTGSGTGATSQRSCPYCAAYLASTCLQRCQLSWDPAAQVNFVVYPAIVMKANILSSSGLAKESCSHCSPSPNGMRCLGKLDSPVSSRSSNKRIARSQASFSPLLMRSHRRARNYVQNLFCYDRGLGLQGSLHI